MKKSSRRFLSILLLIIIDVNAQDAPAYSAWQPSTCYSKIEYRIKKFSADPKSKNPVDVYHLQIRNGYKCDISVSAGVRAVNSSRRAGNRVNLKSQEETKNYLYDNVPAGSEIKVVIEKLSLKESSTYFDCELGGNPILQGDCVPATSVTIIKKGNGRNTDGQKNSTENVKKGRINQDCDGISDIKIKVDGAIEGNGTSSQNRNGKQKETINNANTSIDSDALFSRLKIYSLQNNMPLFLKELEVYFKGFTKPYDEAFRPFVVLQEYKNFRTSWEYEAIVKKYVEDENKRKEYLLYKDK